jgi:hypothetical protein
MFERQQQSALQINFNVLAERLRMDKLEVMEALATKNKRLAAILTDLGEPVFHLTPKVLLASSAHSFKATNTLCPAACRP